MNISKKKNGFTLLLAILISSIILAMSMGIFAIAHKGLILAAFARDSARANAAASRALECAIFYDRINQHAALDHGLTASAYNVRTQNTYTPFARGTSADFSNNYSEAETWPITPGNAVPQGGGANWTLACGGSNQTSYSASASAALNGTGLLQYSFGDTCAEVSVAKNGIDTTFIASGFSDCNASNPRRTLRVIQVTMNI